jgi:AcrR family transcriptional regulator
MEKDENSKQKILNAATKLFAHKGVLRLKKAN